MSVSLEVLRQDAFELARYLDAMTPAAIPYHTIGYAVDPQTYPAPDPISQYMHYVDLAFADGRDVSVSLTEEIDELARAYTAFSILDGAACLRRLLWISNLATTHERDILEKKFRMRAGTMFESDDTMALLIGRRIIHGYIDYVTDS